MKSLLVIAFALALGSMAFAQGEAAPAAGTTDSAPKMENTKPMKTAKVKKAKKAKKTAAEAPATAN